MFIILGWNTKPSKIGFTKSKYMCSNCKNENNWPLVKLATWLTLFFIPIIPDRAQYFLTCPICDNGYSLTKKNILNVDMNPIIIDGKELTVEDIVASTKTPLKNIIIGVVALAVSILTFAAGDSFEGPYFWTFFGLGLLIMAFAVYSFFKKDKYF